MAGLVFPLIKSQNKGHDCVTFISFSCITKEVWDYVVQLIVTVEKVFLVPISVKLACSQLNKLLV